MLDTIDNLTEPTMCSLLDGTVELALAKVFPSQKVCHLVPVQNGYVVVQPTYVWANTSQYHLPVPIDGGDVATLVAALVQRIQWPKDKIIIPPMTRHPNPEAATGSRGTTSNGGAAAQCQQEKAQQQQQQQISKTTQQERRQQPEEEPRQTPPKQQLQLEDNQQLNNNLSSSRSVDNSRRSPGKLRLSSSCNMRISNRRNSSLSSRRRSAGNLPLSSRCNKYNSLYNKSPSNLHCRRGTRPGNHCLKMRFLIVLMRQNGTDQNTNLVHLCCQKKM
jgi:hypothetical protein